MAFINDVAEGVGSAVASRIIDNPKRKKDTIFSRLFQLVKLLLADPEKMELHAFVKEGELNIDIRPDRQTDSRGFIVKLSTYNTGTVNNND